MKITVSSILFMLMAVLLVTGSRALNIYETLQSQADMTTLVSLVDGQPAVKARLESASDDTTLFAPTNLAISNALAGGFNAADANLVLNTLLYHAVDGTVLSTDLAATQAVPTLVTDSNYVGLNGNGQVLVITVSSASGVTVSYGLGSGSVVAADITADNGVVHKVDALLQLPSDVVTTGTQAGLTTLLAAVIRADLADTLLAAEGITVFAPTNQAFADLGVDLDSIPVADLRDILLYHVVGSPIYSSNLMASQKVQSLQGDSLTVRATSSGVTVDGSANVVVADALIENGVVHVIDAVLAPSGDGSPAGHLTVCAFLALGVATFAALM